MFNYGDKVACNLTVWVIPASSFFEVVKGVWDRNRRLLVLLSQAVNYALTDVKKVLNWTFSTNTGTGPILKTSRAGSSPIRYLPLTRPLPLV